ncbi:hypothetical protein CA13_65850 [Planctomycetes bacterium CA13]|uniref:Legionella pneumophila major outer membrane protein n=1 Tax=Novipirellula herctigrandis TaxID=2527986 RepID=A0A5C5ZEX9_9BACT|nr:hypothetical protein CA13_65850 [Planctomycetes bacterium CA13]
MKNICFGLIALLLASILNAEEITAAGSPGESASVTPFATFENVFLTPHLTSDLAVERRVSSTVHTDEQFDHSFAYSPRLVLGFVGESGFDVRSRIWWYETDATESFTASAGETLIGRFGFASSGSIAAGADSSLVTSERIELLTVDAEAGQHIKFRLWEIHAGGGVRHMGGSFKYDAQVFDAGGTPQNRRDIGHRFDGIGPTLFSEFRRPIADTGISLLANTRYALLFGDAKTTAFDTASNATVSNLAKFRNMHHVQLGEIQLGIEYSRLVLDGSRLFVQGMWEAQVWQNFGYDIPIQSSSQRSESLEDLGLIGASFNIGIEL